METGKITDKQMIRLMFTMTLVTAIFFNPSLQMRDIQQDAWLVTHIISLFVIIVTLLTMELAGRHPGKTLIQYLPDILGLYLGKAVAGLYTVFFILVSAWSVRQAALLLNVTLSPEVPQAALMISLLAVVYYALKSGLEVWTRVNDIVVVFIMLATLIIIFFPVDQMNLRNLLPVLTHTPGEITLASLPGTALRSEIFFTVMFIPAIVGQAKRLSGGLIWMTVLVGALISGVNVACISIFGALAGGNTEFAFYDLARTVDLGRTLDRMEAIIVVLWIFAVFIKCCMFSYVAVTAAAQTFNVSCYREMIFPMMVLLLALGINSFEGLPEYVSFLKGPWAPFGLTFTVVLPLMLLLIDTVQRRIRRKTT